MASGGAVGKENNVKVWDEIDPDNLLIGDSDIYKTLEKCVDIMRFGVPSSDKRGHYNTTSFRTMPIQTDIVDNIYELLPKGWAKSKSSFNKNCHAMGGLVTLCYIRKYYKAQMGAEATDIDKLLLDKIDDLYSLIMKMNVLAKACRRDELNNDVASLGEQVRVSTMENRDDALDDVRQMYEESNIIFVDFVKAETETDIPVEVEQ